MKLFLTLLLSTYLLYAKSQESCYSVQLSSFVLKKNSSYDFDTQDYPRYCALMEIGKMSTVRCGCYEEYESAQKEHENLLYFYPASTIVTTYKSRFKDLSQNKKIFKKEESHKRTIKLPEAAQTKTVLMQKIKKEAQIEKKEQEVTYEPPKQEDFSYLEKLSVRGDTALETQHYLQAPQEKNLQNYTLETNLNFEYQEDDLTLTSKIKAQVDYSDVLQESKNERTYLRLDELYAKYDFLEEQILIGKNILFWGALEVRNITDNFNPQDLRDDPFDMDKLGVWNTSYSHYTDSGEISLIVKFYEQERKMSAFPYVYYYFPSKIQGLPYIYKDTLISEDGQRRPSFYLKYSGTSDTQYPIDYAFVIENGYDSQRYFTATPNTDGTKINTQENAYMVNKISTFNTSE